MDFRSLKIKLTRSMTAVRLLLAKDGSKRIKILKKKKILGAIGENCWYEPHKLPAEPKLVFLGDNVTIGTEVLFLNHDFTATMFYNMYKGERRYKGRKGEIHIGNNVFVGGRSIILYDVNIGNNVIIAAGSIVTKDIPDNSVAAGVPAKVIKTFDEYAEEMEKNRIK